MTLPLAGLKVIAVEQYGAGPWGTLYLADLGAEVVKIENPVEGGDVGRSVGPHFFGPHDSHFHQTFNRNKKSMTLNLQAAEGRSVLADLARGRDAVLDNLRGDLAPKLGVTYGQLKDVNPRIVCAHLSAYGRDGPRARTQVARQRSPDQHPVEVALVVGEVDALLGLGRATEPVPLGPGDQARDEREHQPGDVGQRRHGGRC